MYRVKIAFLIVTVLWVCMLDCSGKNNGGKADVSFPDSIVEDELLATVNNYPIRGRDLKVFSATAGMGGSESQSAREYNEQLMEEYIHRILLWQEAVAMSITVEDSVYQLFIGDFIQSVGGEEVLKEMLTQAGIERHDFLSSIRRDLVIRKFMEMHFSPDATVEESEARAYFDQNRSKFSTPDSVRARHILLHVGPDVGDAEKKEKLSRIKEIHSQAKSGSSFAGLAERYSEGPSKDRGGDLGYFSRGTMVQPFDSVAFALETGEISEVVETRYGYHIIKVEDKKKGLTFQFEDVKESLMNEMMQQKLLSLVQNHLQEIYGLAIIKKNY